MRKVENVFAIIGLINVLFWAISTIGIGDYRLYYGADFTKSHMCTIQGERNAD